MGSRNLIGSQWCKTAQFLPITGGAYHVRFGETKSASHGPREHRGCVAAFYSTVKTACIRS